MENLPVSQTVAFLAFAFFAVALFAIIVAWIVFPFIVNDRLKKLLRSQEQMLSGLWAIERELKGLSVRADHANVMQADLNRAAQWLVDERNSAGNEPGASAPDEAAEFESER